MEPGKEVEAAHEEEEDELCCICLSELSSDKISVAKIDCNSCNASSSSSSSSSSFEDHSFHADCIKEWIVKSSKGAGQSRRFLPKCPLCKQDFKNITIACREQISVADFKRSAAWQRLRVGEGGVPERAPGRRGARISASEDFIPVDEEEEERESIGSCIVCDEHCIRSSSTHPIVSLFCSCGQCVHSECLERAFGRHTSASGGSRWTCFLCQNVEIYRQRKRQAQLRVTDTPREVIAAQISRARHAAAQPSAPPAAPAASGGIGASSSAVAESLRLMESLNQGQQQAPLKIERQRQRPGGRKRAHSSDLLREVEEALAKREGGR